MFSLIKKKKIQEILNLLLSYLISALLNKPFEQRKAIAIVTTAVKVTCIS